MAYDNIGNDISRGFDRLSKDLREMTDKINRSFNSIDRDLSNTARQVNNRVEPAVNRTASFLGETFTREYNKPALWSRDLVTMMGRTPRDMTSRQAQAYATDHWNQRLGQAGSDVLTNLLPLGMYMFGGIPGIIGATAMETLMPPEISKARRINQYSAMIDRSSQNYMLSSNSSNSITGRGWSIAQRNEIAKFHAMTENKDKLINGEEQMVMAEMAGLGGYFKGTRTTDEYKNKYRKLIEGTKEAMKTLHMSLEEATNMMNEISSMGINNSTGFISNVSLAAARSGMSSDQVMSYARNIGASLNMAGIGKEGAYNLATGMITDKPGVNRYNIESVTKTVNSPALIAGFMGKDGIDEKMISGFLSGETSYRNVLKQGATYMSGLNISELYKFKHNAADMFEKALGPERTVLVSGQVEYKKLLDFYHGTNVDVDEIFRERYRNKGYSPEATEEALEAAKTPGKGQSMTSYYDQGDSRSFGKRPYYIPRSINDMWKNTGITSAVDYLSVGVGKLNNALYGRKPVGKMDSDLMKGEMLYELGAGERYGMRRELGGYSDPYLYEREDRISIEYWKKNGKWLDHKQLMGLNMYQSMSEVIDMANAVSTGGQRHPEEEIEAEYKGNRWMDYDKKKDKYYYMDSTEVRMKIHGDIAMSMANVFDFKKDKGSAIFSKLSDRYRDNEKMFENVWQSFMLNADYGDVDIPALELGGKPKTYGEILDSSLNNQYRLMGKKYKLGIGYTEIEKLFEGSDAYRDLLKGDANYGELVDSFTSEVTSKLFKNKRGAGKNAGLVAKDFMSFMLTPIYEDSMVPIEYLQDDGTTDAHDKDAKRSGYQGLMDPETVDKVHKILDNLVEATKNNEQSSRLNNQYIRDSLKD